jgi:predicted transcriptional regulator of viral defense system
MLPDGGWKGRKTTKTGAAVQQSKILLKEKAIELAWRLGVARTKDFAQIGISRHYVCKLAGEGVLARAGYGQYSVPKEAA